MFGKIFSFKGTFNRKEYLLYGMLVPFLLIIFAGIMAAVFKEQNTLTGIIFMIVFLMNIYISLAAAVKRARDTTSSIALLIFLWIFFMPIAVIYLMFAPGKPQGEATGSSSAIGVIVAIIFAGIIIMGILAAVAIPKLAKVRNDAKQAQQKQLMQTASQSDKSIEQEQSSNLETN